jgi:hypothetical protein
VSICLQPRTEAPRQRALSAQRHAGEAVRRSSSARDNGACDSGLLFADVADGSGGHIAVFRRDGLRLLMRED